MAKLHMQLFMTVISASLGILKAYLVIQPNDLHHKSSFAKNTYNVHLNHIYLDLPNIVNITIYYYKRLQYVLLLHVFLNICNVTASNTCPSQAYEMCIKSLRCASKALGRHFAGSGPISPSRELLLLLLLSRPKRYCIYIRVLCDNTTCSHTCGILIETILCPVVSVYCTLYTVSRLYY